MMNNNMFTKSLGVPVVGRKHKILITRPLHKESLDALVLLLNDGWVVLCANAGDGYIEYILYKDDIAKQMQEAAKAVRELESVVADLINETVGSDVECDSKRNANTQKRTGADSKIKYVEEDDNNNDNDKKTIN